MHANFNRAATITPCCFFFFLKWKGDKVITSGQLEKGAEGVAKSFSNPNILVRMGRSDWTASSLAHREPFVGKQIRVCFLSLEAGLWNLCQMNSTWNAHTERLPQHRQQREWFTVHGRDTVLPLVHEFDCNQPQHRIEDRVCQREGLVCWTVTEGPHTFTVWFHYFLNSALTLLYYYYYISLFFKCDLTVSSWDTMVLFKFFFF